MKTLLPTFGLVLISLSAFPQAKISFANDSLHLVYFCPDAESGLAPQDAALAGQGVISSPTPSGITLLADLYAGTSSSALTLQATTTFSSITPGRWNSDNVVLNGIPGGSPAYFEVVVRDATFTPAYLGDTSGGSYFGFSPIFTAVPGAGVVYPPLYRHSSPVFSTWPDGDYDMSAQTGVPGALGSIHVGYLECIPEPASLTLMCLAAAVPFLGRKRECS